MNSNQRLIDYVENSFLKELLLIPTVTDISYNGVDVFYEDRETGRKKYGKAIAKEQVADFLRQIANFSEQQFSYMNPILDVTFGRYRLNAVFASVTRVRDEKSYSFAMRLAKEGSALFEDPSFFPSETKEALLSALENRRSIVVAGETGSGKTELQKYLLLSLKENTRVIVIDNVQELELSRGDGSLDLTSWHVDEKNKDASFSSLIRNALRSNPDYLIVAETRGAEMLDALNGVMSGHPIITTLHSEDLESIPQRMARLAMMGGEKLVYEDLLGDIYHHFDVLVHVKKEQKRGSILRYIDALGIINHKAKKIDYLYPKEAKQ